MQNKPWESPELIRDADVCPIDSINPADSEFGGFTNTGFAYIKRTKVVDGQEQPVIDAIPISTARIDKVRHEFSRDRLPKPPILSKFIHQDSEEGRALGLAKSQVVEIPNFADDTYRQTMVEFTERFNWSLAAEAVSVKMFHKPDAASPAVLAVSTADKITALKQAGFKYSQIESIASDILRISNFTEEERRSFFGLNSGS